MKKTTSVTNGYYVLPMEEAGCGLSCNIPWSSPLNRGKSGKSFLGNRKTRHSSFCRLGRLVSNSLDWSADMQSLSAKISGDFGQTSISKSAFQVAKVGGFPCWLSFKSNPSIIAPILRINGRTFKSSWIYYIHTTEVLKKKQLPNVVQSSRPARAWTRTVQRTTDDLPVKQCAVSDGGAISPATETA
jgi:hypothetical protein